MDQWVDGLHADLLSVCSCAQSLIYLCVIKYII